MFKENILEYRKKKTIEKKHRFEAVYLKNKFLADLPQTRYLINSYYIIVISTLQLKLQL